MGTQISFEITADGAQTKVRFIHLGLVPEYERFQVCFDAWSSLMRGSLPRLITTGKGEPYK